MRDFIRIPENGIVKYEDGSEYPVKQGDLLISAKAQEKSINYRNLQSHAKELGGFTYLNNKIVFNSITPATLGRLAYLSTYLGFNNQLLLDDENKPLLKKDLESILKINKHAVSAFYKECIDNDLLIDKKKEGLYITELFFRRKTTGNDQIRLYKNPIRKLYDALEPKSHRYFGYVVQIIPWINREWNIICENPEETNDRLIVPFSLKNICDTLHYDENNVTRLKEALSKPIFKWENEKQQLCVFIRTSVESENECTVQCTGYVNPLLMYCGNNYSRLEAIAISFMKHSKRKKQD